MAEDVLSRGGSFFMFASVLSAAVVGFNVYFVTVEADVSDGLPGLHMVGYLASDVREAGERVRTALRNSGVRLPAKRMIVNLAPADLRKQGSMFDLAIALALSAALGEIPLSSLSDILILGEMSLNGEICSVPGVLPMVQQAFAQGIRTCILLAQNALEGKLVSGMRIIGMPTLGDVLEYLRTGYIPDVVSAPGNENRNISGYNAEPDFSDIHGQSSVKRAALIAAAGCHNLLLTGPPGSGKTMTARRLPSIMPPMSFEESIQLSCIYSVSGLLEEHAPLITARPFRAPHHTVSGAALIGGGPIPKPGEVTLASYGVLFLDELTEYRRSVLELLRQPLEEHTVCISRTRGTFLYPADFLLVAAMNPCPCGYYPDRSRCTCSSGEISRYRDRISKPLLDRMDLCLEVEQIHFEDVAGTFDRGRSVPEEISSSELRALAYRAWQIQQERYMRLPYSHNGRIPSADLPQWCGLDAGCRHMMASAFGRMGLSARSCHRILRVARTIADLEGTEHIHEEHLAEALAFRIADPWHAGF